MKIRLLKENPVIIVISAALLAAGLVYAVVFYPLAKGLEKKLAEYRAVNSAMEEAGKLARQARPGEEEIAILTKKDLPAAIEELSSLGSSLDIEFVSLVPSASYKETVYEVFPIEAQMSSGYKKLGVFLGALNKLRKSLVSVKDFKIEPASGDNSVLNTRLTLKMYLLAQDE